MFTKDELLHFNETMLGRGVPNQDDGLGYNKADYGACSNYFYGLSNAQYADLAKRLVKYTKTQLKVDKELMKETANYFENLSRGQDKNVGISVNINKDGVLVSFKYNEKFINKIQEQPKNIRKYNPENKKWILSNNNAVEVLKSLEEVGADVKNAIDYIKSFS